MSKSALGKIGFAIAVAAVATLAVVPMLSRERSVAAAQDLSSGKPARAAPLTRVVVTTPSNRPLTRTLRMPATLLPGEAADLFAKTSGYVSSVVVDIGSRVEKGDTLLTIDVPEMADELRQANAVLAARRTAVQALRAKVVQARRLIEIARAEVDRYEARLQLGELNLKRKRELREGNAIPQQALDEALSAHAVAEAQLRISLAQVAGSEAELASTEAEVSVAQSEVAVAEADAARLRTLMRYAKVSAPFTGVITARMVDPGAFVRSAADGTTTPLLTIANDDYIRVTLGIPESDVPFVHIGTKVEIDVRALGGDPIQATVTRTAVALQADTRTMRVEVDVDNADGRLAPGMYAQVVVNLQYQDQAMVIPSQAIRVRGRDVSVMVADGGVASSRPITIGYDDGIWTEVLTGLSGEERVIVSASGVLTPGTPIKATDASSSS